LVFENIELIKTLPGNGLIKKFKEASKKMNAKDASKDMFEALTKNAKKAEFALELLFIQDPNTLKTPTYIAQGLTWLHDKLKMKQTDIELPK
ncbi:MAG: ATP-dependent endonuclease, partial [Bacteroidia bacterium]